MYICFLSAAENRTMEVIKQKRVEHCVVISLTKTITFLDGQRMQECCTVLEGWSGVPM